MSDAEPVNGATAEDYPRVLTRALADAHMLEHLVRTTLLRALAKDAWATEQLDEILLRLDFGRKVTMLEQWFTATGQGTQPLIGQLRAMNDLRNTVAHGMPVANHDRPDVLLLAGRFRQSGVKVHEISVADAVEVHTGAEQAKLQLVELLILNP